MKMIFEFNMPEDRFEAIQMQFADVAWSAISDAIQDIRSHIKHDALEPADLIAKLYRDLSEALERRDA